MYRPNITSIVTQKHNSTLRQRLHIIGLWRSNASRFLCICRYGS